MRYALVALSAVLSSHAAHAQLTPDRLYSGVNREVPMTVAVPEGKSGEVTIKLLEPVTAVEAASASAAPGKVNLATLFPMIWTDPKPRVRYAQLVVGTEKIGPAVVLQPLLAPALAFLTPQGRIDFRPSQGPLSGLRTYVDKHVVLDTTAGEIEIRLRPDAAPNHVWNFRSLVEGGFYTDILFHRIVPTGRGGPFVIQAGDPTGTGQGGPGYHIDLEPSTLPHDFGVLSMARTAEPDTAGSQFFLCLSREGTSFLDGQYTTFGQTVRGAEAIVAISASKLNGERPVEDVKIKSARLVDAPPLDASIKPVTRPAAPATQPTR